MDFYQPEGSYRFSSDAVCAVRFACSLIVQELQKKKVKDPYLIMDVGCGCGVIGILVLQFFKELYPEWYPYLMVVGIEKKRNCIRPPSIMRNFSSMKKTFSYFKRIFSKRKVSLRCKNLCLKRFFLISFRF